MRVLQYFFAIFVVVSCSTTRYKSPINFSEIDRDIIIIDIDNTIADVSPWEFLFLGHDEIPPLENSSSILNEFQKKYYIIYLTARHETFKEHTIAWLRHNKFPEAPILFWNLSDFPFFDDDYKKVRLAEIEKSKRNVVFAVGDRDTDIEAYTSFGHKSYIIRDHVPVDAHELVNFVKSWDEINLLENK